MTLLFNHLEQISSSARTIGELPFPPPKIFTNALLGNHEITTLIRDTEPHERALFSLDPQAKFVPTQHRSKRRTTTFPIEENNRLASFNVRSRKQSAVARVLGTHMQQEIESHGGRARNQKSGGLRGIDVEILLEGAEKLCSIYPVSGASEQISSLRRRYKEVAESVAECERKVSRQAAQLDQKIQDPNNWNDDDAEEGDKKVAAAPRQESLAINEDELRAEAQEIRELEQKKRALEERVASMEKDLGGLLQ